MEFRNRQEEEEYLNLIKRLKQEEEEKLKRLMKLAQELPENTVFKLATGFYISRHGIVIKEYGQFTRSYRFTYDQIESLPEEAIEALRKKLRQVDDEVLRACEMVRKEIEENGYERLLDFNTLERIRQVSRGGIGGDLCVIDPVRFYREERNNKGINPQEVPKLPENGRFRSIEEVEEYSRRMVELLNRKYGMDVTINVDKGERFIGQFNILHNEIDLRLPEDRLREIDANLIPLVVAHEYGHALRLQTEGRIANTLQNHLSNLDERTLLEVERVFSLWSERGADAEAIRILRELYGERGETIYEKGMRELHRIVSDGDAGPDWPGYQDGYPSKDERIESGKAPTKKNNNPFAPKIPERPSEPRPW